MKIIMSLRSHNNRFIFLLMAVTCLFTASCSERSPLPPELKLERVLHQTEEQHPVGPGGLNQSFTVYELPKEVSASIADRGLSYINTLPSIVEQKRNFKPPQVDIWREKDKNGKIITHTATGPYWAPFVIWNATPVPKEERWLRNGRGSGKEWKPSIETYYAKEKFISQISTELSDQFHEAISTPGNFYAYGFYRDQCLIVVSPKMNKAFYLFRD